MLLVHAVVRLLSCVRFFSAPWTIACQAPLSMGFSRQRYWSGVPLPSPAQHQTWDLLASQLVLFFFLQRFLFLTTDLTMYATCRESEYSQSGREESSVSHTNRVQALKRTYRDIWMPRKEPVWLLWGRESCLFSTGGERWHEKQQGFFWASKRVLLFLLNLFIFSR